ncbi:MAG: hypothetical protein WCQ70_07670 [Lentimicrobiaceae bacterium]
MKERYTLLLIAIITSFLSCDKMDSCKDKELTLKRNEYTGQTLKINGFYYGRPTTDYQGLVSYELFIFYQNGIMMLPGNVELNKMEEYVSMISKPGTIKAKYDWGLFIIDDKKINIDHWVPAQCGYPAVLRSGDIINDTSFVLRKMVRRDSQGTKETVINEEFHFRQFDIKPDSTNNFLN